MMLTDYFTRHLHGAWRLLRGDEAGLSEFDLSTDGFYRSFWAMAAAFALALPGIVADHRAGLAFAAQMPDVQFAMPLRVYAVTEMTAYLIGWGVFLWLMMTVARRFGVANRYGAYVIVYNWASLLMVCISLPLALAQLGGLITWDLALALQIILGLIFLTYSWYIAVKALQINGWDAGAVVALEILLYFILAIPVEKIYAAYGA